MKGQNFNFILLLSFFVILLASCNSTNKQQNADNTSSENLYPFRAITPSELDSFIPQGYALNAQDVKLTERHEPLYINLDEDSENEVVLILEHVKYKEGANAIISALKFNPQSDKWIFLSADTLKRERVSKEFHLTDLDKDSLKEIHLMTNSIGLNYYDGTPVILELSKGGKLTNLFPHSKPTEITYVFDDKTGNYYNVSYIWAEGEGHWGCHYFQVEVYTFAGHTYTLKEKKVTSKRYGLDPGDSTIGGCTVYNIETILTELQLK